MTLSERLRLMEEAQNLPADRHPMQERPVRRQTPRWIEYTRQHENRGSDLTGYVKEAA